MGNRMYDAVIFDLDGTLLNTLQDLYLSTNYALTACGFPQRSLEEIRNFVGNGVVNQIRRAVPDGTSQEEALRCQDLFRHHYEEHKYDHTEPYPGVISMLEELNRMGREIAVVSNKFDPAVKDLCGNIFSGLITIAVGEKESEGIQKKPAPDMVEQVLKMLEMEAEQAIYVGDSQVDIETAHNARIPCISVTWGFRTRQELLDAGAERLIDKPWDLLEFI